MKRFFQTFLLFIALATGGAFAASANVTVGGGGREIECDGTQRTATLNSRGGSILNKSSASVWIQLDAGTVGTTSGDVSIEIAQGTSIKLPETCVAFTFKTAGSTSYLIFLGK